VGSILLLAGKLVAWFLGLLSSRRESPDTRAAKAEAAAQEATRRLQEARSARDVERGMADKIVASRPQEVPPRQEEIHEGDPLF